MRNLLFVVLVGFCLFSNSQDTLEHLIAGKYKFSAVAVYSDANKYEYTTDDLNLMYDLVKNEVESGFIFDSLYPTTFKNQSISFHGASIIFTRSETREIELGISFSSQVNRSNWFVYDRYVRADTIPDLNHTVFLDTAFRRFQNAEEDITSLNLNFRKIHRTNPNKSFIVYGGIGVNAGFTIVSRIVTRSNDYTYLKYNIDNQDYFNFSKVHYFEQNPDVVFDTKKSLFTRLYVPFGVNLAFSTEDNFFKRFFIDIRSCFGFEHQQVFGSSGYVRAFYSFGLGLRYSFE